MLQALLYVLVSVASLLALVHLLTPKSSVLELGSWPAVPWLYAQLIMSLSKKRVGKDAQRHITNRPQIQVSVSRPLAFNAARFHRFVRLCDYNNTAGCVPLMYPIAESFRLCMQAMVLPAFPFTVIGSVLARNTTVMLRPLRVEERVQYRVSIDPGSWRMTPKGDVEVDLVSEATLPGGDEVVWRSTTTSILLNPKRPTGKPGAKGAAAPAPAPSRKVIATWRLGSDVGRKYGMINGDLNPIHVHALLSRLFGFRRPIAHALFLVSLAEAALRRTSGMEVAYPAKLVTEFKRPTLLPATLECVVEPSSSDGSVSFAVMEGPKEVLTGILSKGP